MKTNKIKEKDQEIQKTKTIILINFTFQIIEKDCIDLYVRKTKHHMGIIKSNEDIPFSLLSNENFEKFFMDEKTLSKLFWLDVSNIEQFMEKEIKFVIKNKIDKKEYITLP